MKNSEAYRALSEFASARIWGKNRGFGPGSSMGIFDETGHLAGAVIYHNHDEDAKIIEYSGASDKATWLPLSVIYEIFNYAFNKLQNVETVFTRTDGTNRKLHRIYMWYGFTVHEVPHMRGPGKSEFVYVLPREAWLNNGKHKDKHNV